MREEEGCAAAITLELPLVLVLRSNLWKRPLNPLPNARPAINTENWLAKLSPLIFFIFCFFSLPENLETFKKTTGGYKKPFFQKTANGGAGIEPSAQVHKRERDGDGDV